MAESKGLSTIIRGGIPSNPREIKGFIDNLPIAIGLIQFREKQKDFV